MQSPEMGELAPWSMLEMVGASMGRLLKSYTCQVRGVQDRFKQSLLRAALAKYAASKINLNRVFFHSGYLLPQVV